ncbi:FxLD family lantipeptide [Thermocatellispora tengchongensis]|uniref:FxLD family lantipeptide n=1 Tax=Thermocatellispora tengchongensis TaxID=1073253 RepID=A0A840PVU2_9ACTN|nr:FxLD family lanthipeptide [Thermocatellispora tengchongensis]MBB5140005.1 FxLD family lantipeptide [Thermocatellispora tengchongensis]
MTAAIAFDGSTTVVSEEDWDLDMQVIESSYPIAALACDTNDGCGSTCASACNSSAADPA